MAFDCFHIAEDLEMKVYVAVQALRLGEGDEVQLCDGRGGLLHARITAAGRKQVTVEALAPPTQVRERRSCLEAESVIA